MDSNKTRNENKTTNLVFFFRFICLTLQLASLWSISIEKKEKHAIHENYTT